MPPTTSSEDDWANWGDPHALSTLNLPAPPSVLSTSASFTSSVACASPISSVASENVPGLYTIDLSLPPAQRYVKVAQDFKHIIEDLVNIFDELLDSVGLPKKMFHLIARCILRKLYSKEQTEELKGIGKATGVPMYLLVAYNVLLDLFMGCTSGGVMVKEGREREGRMMHFRTLDWGMPALRKAVVLLEFRNGADGEVIARSINYVGFVGTLTGVRKGLSVSLNFRPYHNDDGSKWANVKFYSHLLFVLLAWRPSICAHLRDLIIPTGKDLEKRRVEIKKEEDKRSDKRPSKYKYAHGSLADIGRDFPSIPTTAAYLTFSDGSQTLILEKDRVTAKPLLSSSFIAVTNHDTSYEPPSIPTSSLDSTTSASQAHAAHAKAHQIGTDMDVLVDESMERKGCVTSAWEEHCNSGKTMDGDTWTPSVELEKLKEWLLKYPVVNEQTHFVAVMDPTEGVFRWVRAYEEGEIENEDEEDWSDMSA
ncbi:hypothetical protein K505DRAFT_329211 [Melanomma pulvis-pyrius CBS 109.77]|uniref:ceramidase n=1 Tax=Melanomma pulvis-pyrius CBS 109.77 TaxID=1314802 RepID=A0A6A6WW00_9PLEO|nr:hypothetical protein K505DRAFT_329211 [Melanomma pulvis-pyrius CBS 109.77]